MIFRDTIYLREGGRERLRSLDELGMTAFLGKGR